MPKKMFALSDSDVYVISKALAQLATFHFEKSKKLKREEDVLFHEEQFQKVSEVRFNFLEQE